MSYFDQCQKYLEHSVIENKKVALKELKLFILVWRKLSGNSNTRQSSTIHMKFIRSLFYFDLNTSNNNPDVTKSFETYCFLQKEEAKWYLKTVQGFPESEELSHNYAFKWSLIVEWLILMIKKEIS